VVRHHSDAHPLFEDHLHPEFVGVKGRRWLEDSGRRIRAVLDPFGTSENANELLDSIIVRGEIFIRNRPIDS
jgi:hypothetical protein